jgi:hypothetical protein
LPGEAAGRRLRSSRFDPRPDAHLIANAQAELFGCRCTVDRDFQKARRADYGKRSANGHGTVEWRDGAQAFAPRKNFARLVAKDSQTLPVNVRDQIAEMVNVNNFTINLSIEES